MDLVDYENLLTGSDDITLIGSQRSRLQNMKSSSSSLHSRSQTSIVNSATFARHSDADTDFSDSDFDNQAGGDAFDNSSTKISRIHRIELTPEQIQAKKEKHAKWLQEKLARQRAQRQLEQEKLDHEQQLKEQAEEERRQKSETSLKMWLDKKKRDAERKQTRLKQAEIDFLQRQQAKKEKLTKQISYNEWVESKAAEVKQQPRKIDRKPKKSDDKVKVDKSTTTATRQVKSQLSYDDWLAASASKPKPVPLNQGLATLRGCLSKLQVNPVPWKTK